MKSVLLIFLFIISQFIAKAESVYPLEVGHIEHNHGGRLLSAEINSQIKFFFFKNDFSRGSLSVSAWIGFDKINKKGINITNANGLDYKIQDTLLYCLWNNDRNLYLSIYNFELELISESSIAEINPFVELTNSILYVSNRDEIFISFQNSLFFFSKQENKISRKLNLEKTDILFFTDDNFVILKSSNSNGILKLYNFKGSSKNETIVVSYDLIKFINIGSDLYLITSTENSNQSLVQEIDINSGVVDNFFWIDAPINMIDIKSNNAMTYLVYQYSNDFSYRIRLINLRNKSLNQLGDFALPTEFIDSKSLNLTDGKIISLYSNGINIFDLKGEILCRDYLRLPENKGDIFNLENKNSLLIYSSFNLSTLIKIDENKFWYVYDFYYSIAKYGLIIIFIVIILVLLQLYRHQKRLFNEILRHPAIGSIFIIDEKGRLLKSNTEGSKLLNLNANTPKNKLFRYYSKNELSDNIADLIELSVQSRENIKQKISIIYENTPREWICTTFVLKNIAGRFRGIIFSGIDITEQLERQRLANLAQLAHDMQTNLSIIKLNTEQLDFNTSDNNAKRKDKILNQINLLIQKVRDIVTVGRTDSLDLKEHDSCDIISQVLTEFDVSLYPNIHFNIHCSDFKIVCDKPKLSRVLRNAVENSIKSIKDKEGIIEIIGEQDILHSTFHVNDNGIGMDETVRKKMLTPYFTTAKKNGGSGIGTMIMQKVIELHGGEIIVSSEVGKGTKISFVIPRAISKSPKIKNGKFDAK